MTTGQLTFDRIQLHFLRSMAEALFDDFAEMAIGVDQVVENMQELVGMIGGTKAQEISLAATLAQIAMAPFFEELSVASRKARLLHRMADTHCEALQELARLKSILYFCYYGHWQDPDGAVATRLTGQIANEHNPVLRQIGFTLPVFRDRTQPGQVRITLVPGREIDPSHFVPVEHDFTDIDVIVVGSGSGGAVSALNLAKHGHKVLIIEAGPHYPSPDITHEERRMASQLFKHGALQTTSDNAIVIFQGRNVGGSPTINNGICIRMHGDPLNHPDAPNPLEKWREIGAGLDEARFSQAYDAVQEYLHIRQIEPRSSVSNGPHLLRGWAQFAATHDEAWAQRAPAGWFAKNFGPADSPTPCAYCGYCNTGCPYGRKLGMAQTYLPDATANHGALILAETRVDRIVWADTEANANAGQRRAIGVVVTDADGGEHHIGARKGVVVAAGTIASSLLLDRSGIAGTGQQISMNVASPVIALMPPATTDPTVSPAWDEDQMATMVDCGDFLFESHFQPPLSMASLMPGWFGDMDQRMRAYDRICSAGVLFPADRRGEIVGGKLSFKLTQDDLEVLRRASATLAKVHFAGGALEVWPALLRGQTLTPDMDIDAFFESAIQETDDVTVSSSHIHGGNPINADPELGVVDTECRVHGTANVLVTDASVFPSCIRVNAQFTTMAIAQYATGFTDPFN